MSTLQQERKQLSTDILCALLTLPIPQLAALLYEGFNGLAIADIDELRFLHAEFVGDRMEAIARHLTYDNYKSIEKVVEYCENAFFGIEHEDDAEDDDDAEVFGRQATQRLLNEPEPVCAPVCPVARIG